jgi:uncharacterized membrane protein
MALAEAFLMVGAAGLTTVTAIAAGRTTNPATLVTLLDLQVNTERIGTTLGAVITLIFGAVLVEEAGFDFGDYWITFAIILWVVALGIDHGMFIPWNRKLRARAAQMVQDGVEQSEELCAEVRALKPTLIGLGLDAMLLFFIFLMVVKPGA